jgi:hypothetical protein
VLMPAGCHVPSWRAPLATSSSPGAAITANGSPERLIATPSKRRTDFCDLAAYDFVTPSQQPALVTAPLSGAFGRLRISQS